jgi:MFS family permease
MQRVAMGWLVYRLTRSPLALGTIDFVASLPIFLLSPLAGAWLERKDLRKAFFVCQALCMTQALLLAFLTGTDLVTYAQVVGICLFLGLVDAFEMPVRQAFVVQLVERKEDLSNALALNSGLFNVARLIGPTMAGWAIARLGEAVCFLINGMAYGATLWALHRIRIPAKNPAEARPSPSSPLENLREGWRHAAFPPIRYALLTVAAFSFIGFSFLILMPAVAKDVLRGDSRTMGLLLAASGVGALAGAVSSIAFGVSVAAFSLARSLVPAAIFLVLSGFFMVRTTVAGNTFIQSLVDDDKRSRVMSLYVMAIMGISPFGSLASGALARAFGVPATLFLSGVFCTTAGIYFARRFSACRPVVLEALRHKGFAAAETAKG